MLELCECSRLDVLRITSRRHGFSLTLNRVVFLQTWWRVGVIAERTCRVVVDEALITRRISTGEGLIFKGFHALVTTPSGQCAITPRILFPGSCVCAQVLKAGQTES